MNDFLNDNFIQKFQSHKMGSVKTLFDSTQYLFSEKF